MLSRFRSQITGTVEEPPKTPEEALSALRASISPLETPETKPYLTDSCLHRYLTARNNDVPKARKMLESTIAWRSTYQPDKLTDDIQTLRFESSTGKMFVLPHADAQHRSIIIMRTGLENSRDSRGNIANLVYTLERASRTAHSCGGSQYIVLVDYSVGEVSASTLPNLSTMRETTAILQGHYPERLAMMVLIQAPRLFHSMFNMVKQLVDVKTREKVHFVDRQSDVAAVPGIDSAALPREFGGMLDWQFDVDAYFEGVGKQ